jgi:hypothetical protein
MTIPKLPPRHRAADELSVGALLFSASSLGLYASLRGLWLYARGSREAFADPAICLLILVAAPWGLGVARRLFRGSRPGEALLPSRELLIGSILALGGAAWILISHLGTAQMVLGFGALGLGGLVLWWRRRSQDRPAQIP